MNRRTTIISGIDWVLISLYLIMVFFGWLNIFAAGFNSRFSNIFDLNTTYGDQLLWIIISFTAVLIILLVDYKIYHFFAYVFYGLAILLLLMVIAFGTEVNGAKSWIRIAGFTIQPSEFAKIGTCLALSRFLSGYQTTKFNLKSIGICAGIIGLPFLLILIQPDPGTSIVFCIFLLVLFREGLPGWVLVILFFLAGLFLFSLIFNAINIIIGLMILTLIVHYFTNKRRSLIVYYIAFYILLLIAASYINRHFKLGYSFSIIALALTVFSGGVYVLIALKTKLANTFILMALLVASSTVPYSVDYVFHKFLMPHQQKRINIMLGKEVDPKGYGYNVNQSKIAIGSGGFSGKGFLNGTQTKLDFVPEQSTDFIFCTVGEEWGFVGTSIVVLLFAGLIIRIIIVAERQRTKFNRVFGYGVASIIFFHFVINISMTIGLFPVIGIPLPFFSKGGSSLLGFSILLFILIRLDSSRKSYLN